MADRRFKPKKRPSRARNHVVLLILLAVLLAGSAFMFAPPDQKITQGLDVQGGLSVVLQASKADGSAPSLEEMQSSQQIVERRVNALGASETSVQVQGTNQLLVQIPGLVDQTQALQTIGQTGILEFVDLSLIDDPTIKDALNSTTLLSEQDINEMLAFGNITADQIATQLVNGRAPAGMYSQVTTTAPAAEESATGEAAATDAADGSSAPASDSASAAASDPSDAASASASATNDANAASDSADPASTNDPAAASDPAESTSATAEPTDVADATGAGVADAASDPASQITYYVPLSLTADSYTPVFTGADITSVSLGQQSQTSSYYSVNIKLNAEATQAWADTTTKLYPTKGKVAIVLDGVIQSTPAVQNAITSGETSITGDYNLSAATALKTVLESGSLPVSLQVINSQVVGPTLGQESLMQGVLVALIGLALVALYLLIFYRGIGLLTAGAVAVFALLYLGVLATLSYFNQFALTLAGIAGIVLAIGVAADSSILVLERFKEEIRMGRSVRASSITGVKHAIITSIDADLVTLVSALALFFIGIGSVKGFGLTLALGVVCDIVTMLIFKAPLIRLLAPRIIAKHPGFWGVKEDQEIALAAGELNRGATNG